jgi:hypothetical protein
VIFLCHSKQIAGIVSRLGNGDFVLSSSLIHDSTIGGYARSLTTRRVFLISRRSASGQRTNHVRVELLLILGRDGLSACGGGGGAALTASATTNTCHDLQHISIRQYYVQRLGHRHRAFNFRNSPLMDLLFKLITCSSS